MSRCVLLRFVEIWYRRILTYLSDVICHDPIASLDTRKYIQIRLSRYNSQLDLGLIRTSWHGPRFEQLMYMHMRLYTLRYVHPEPMCSLVMGWCRFISRSRCSRMTRLGDMIECDVLRTMQCDLIRWKRIIKIEN